MTALHPAFDAELAGDRATIFGALRIALPAATLRLLDGSAEIDIDGETYAGEDAVLGSWDSIEEFEDGTGDEAPGITVKLLPASDSAAATLADPAVQGSPVMIGIAARDDATGLVIGEPEWFLSAEIDVPVHIAGREPRVEYDCVGGMESLFFNDEGIRLAQSFHEQVWPGELGHSHATGVTENVYWGLEQ
ncbi:hypothetical protein [Stakelama tenebrarum]|uniref:DUF2163 domain-containing protein n=1 Tax=Stakelama tenebrarum TaxID=2711215 RepID=A0A6G6Y5X1_9SPHN|nr:hypothetical protein [Sphingosinithalassobacter tenebrarum]QIG80118.1 hypothetical protein G5C33_10220 [Sphingosinithalassobacter tenebrarum]